MAGRIEKRGGSYRLVAYGGYDSKGEQIFYRKTVKPDPGTPKQVKQQLDKLLAEFVTDVEKGLFIGTSRLTFQDFIDRWRRDYAKPTLSAKAYYEYDRKLELRILPHFGNMRMDRIRPPHIAEFLTKIAEGSRLSPGRPARAATEGAAAEPTTLSDQPSAPPRPPISARTVKDYHTLLAAIFHLAVDWEVIRDNPVKKVKPPKVPKKKPNTYDDDQLALFMQAVDKLDILNQTMIVLALCTSVRQGELMALEWRHVDFDNRTLEIEKSAQYIPHLGQFVKDTKTEESHRVISLPELAINQLRKYKVHQDKLRLQAGEDWQKTGRIFTNWLGNPLRADYMSKWFVKFIRDNNLPKLTFHGLRHTGASLLFDQGLTAADVGRRLGHSSPSTTIAIYIHSLKKADKVAADKMDSILTTLKNKKSQAK